MLKLLARPRASSQKRPIPFMARFSSRNPAKPAVNCNPFPNTSGEPSEHSYLILSVPAAGKAPFQTCDIWWPVRGCLSFLFSLSLSSLVGKVGSGRIASHATGLLFQYIPPQKLSCNRCAAEGSSPNLEGYAREAWESPEAKCALDPEAHILSSWLFLHTSSSPRPPLGFRPSKSRSSLPFKHLGQPFRRILKYPY